MRNKKIPKIPKIRTIYELVKWLPYFSFNDLVGVETNRTYLKILFSRYENSGRLTRLKKGLYVAKDYLDNLEKKNQLSAYLEFVSNLLYEPSYLSLDYILYENNLLTEIPKNFTSVAKNKTANFSNRFGHFFYHKIKDELFCGFEAVKKSDFTIFRATKAKALFDYLYFRKNSLLDKRAVEELRLNLENFTKNDRKELEKYIKIEGTKKMKTIYHLIWKKI